MPATSSRRLLQLGDRGRPLGREPLLDDGVAGERDAHEPDDQLAVVRRLASRGALLGEAHLGEQRAHRRHGAEAVEALARALEEREVGGRVARDVAEAGYRLDLRVSIRVLEREVPNPASVGRDASSELDRKDEAADCRGREDRPTHDLGRSRMRDAYSSSKSRASSPSGLSPRSVAYTTSSISDRASASPSSSGEPMRSAIVAGSV